MSSIISAVIAASATIFAVFWSNKKTLQFQKDKEITDNYVFPIVNVKKITYYEMLNEHLKFQNGRHLIFSANNGLNIELDKLMRGEEIKKFYFHLKNPSSIKRINNIKIVSKVIIKDIENSTSDENESEMYFNSLRPNDNLYLKLLEDSKLSKLISEKNNYEIIINSKIYYSTLEGEYYLYEYEQQINTSNNKVKEITKDCLNKYKKYEIENNSKYIDFIDFLVDNGIDVLTYYWTKQGSAQNGAVINEVMPFIKGMFNQKNTR